MNTGTTSFLLGSQVVDIFESVQDHEATRSLLSMQVHVGGATFDG